MTPESYNTPRGVVKTIRENLRSTHEIFVCEMGARHRGDIKELCDIVTPRHGIITAIGEQHLETMKTMETIVETKFELAEAVVGQGIMFFNGDNTHIREHLPTQDFQTYGLQENNDCYAYDIHATTSGTVFSVSCHGEKIEGLQTPLIGEHNIVNIAGVLAVAAHLGVSAEEMRRQLKKITAPPHRLQLVRSDGMVLIDDAYNSNPSGCEAALKTLALFDGCKILITPGMVELGEKQHECNYVFGEQASAVCDHVILVGEKQTKPIYEGLRNKNYDTTQIQVVNTFDEALNKAYTISTDQQKIILIENDLPDNY
jgi:UDP-N-acetylmuramoyl-tripeptide--D-alanyl-D-alanine ligase